MRIEPQDPLTESDMDTELQEEIREMAPFNRVILEMDIEKDLAFVKALNRQDSHARKLIEGDFDLPRFRPNLDET